MYSNFLPKKSVEGMNPQGFINITLMSDSEAMFHIYSTDLRKKAELGQMKEKILKIVTISASKSIIEHLQW